MPIWIAPKQGIERFAGVDHRSGALHGDGCGLAPGPAASELVSAWIMYFMPQRREHGEARSVRKRHEFLWSRRNLRSYLDIITPGDSKAIICPCQGDYGQVRGFGGSLTMALTRILSGKNNTPKKIDKNVDIFVKRCLPCFPLDNCGS